VHIRCGEGVIVNTVNLAIELENVFYFVNRK